MMVKLSLAPVDLPEHAESRPAVPQRVGKYCPTSPLITGQRHPTDRVAIYPSRGASTIEDQSDGVLLDFPTALLGAISLPCPTIMTILRVRVEPPQPEAIEYAATQGT